MEMSPDLLIIKTIRAGSVFYFPEESFQSSTPHNFVVLNEPLEDGVICLVNCVTLEGSIKVASRYQNSNYPRETLVDVTPEQCSILSKISLFDCNQVLERNVEVLIEKLQKKELIMKGIIEEEILKKLRVGVLNSPVVERRIKKLLS